MLDKFKFKFQFISATIILFLPFKEFFLSFVIMVGILIEGLVFHKQLWKWFNNKIISAQFLLMVSEMKIVMWTLIHIGLIYIIIYTENI
jgi:hypothetical protein